MSDTAEPGSTTEFLHRIRSLDPAHVNVLVAIRCQDSPCADRISGFVGVNVDRVTSQVEYLERTGWVVVTQYSGWRSDTVEVAQWAHPLVDAFRKMT